MVGCCLVPVVVCAVVAVVVVSTGSVPIVVLMIGMGVRGGVVAAGGVSVAVVPVVGLVRAFFVGAGRCCLGRDRLGSVADNLISYKKYSSTDELH